MKPEDIAKILDDLGQRLGPSGEYVFGLAVRQVYVNGIAAFVMFGSLVALGLIIGSRFLRWGRDKEASEVQWFASVILGLTYGTVVTIFAIGTFFDVRAMFNPEYAALSDLLSKIAP